MRPEREFFARRYDAVVGLGDHCSVAAHLNGLHLRDVSLPFDWVVGGNLSSRVSLVVSGFAGALEEANLETCSAHPEWNEPEGRVSACLPVLDCATGLRYLHDFPKDRPMEESLTAVQAKYARRSLRLMTLLDSGAQVLLVYADCHATETAETCRAALARLVRAFPSGHLSLLVLRHEDVPLSCQASEADILCVRGRFMPPGCGYLGDARLHRRVLGRIRTRGTLQAHRARSRVSQIAVRLATMLIPAKAARKRIRTRLQARREAWLREKGARAFFSRRYDCVVSLGDHCSTTAYLKGLHMRKASWPFDWLAGSTFAQRLELLSRRFVGFLSAGGIRPCEPPPGFSRDGVCHPVEDVPSGLILLHDFPLDAPLSEGLAEVRARYGRRTERLLQLLESTANVLLVYSDYGESPLSPDAYAKLFEVFRKAFGAMRTSLLVLRNAEGPMRHERVSDSVQVVSAPFAKGPISWLGDERLNKSVLSLIRLQGPLERFRRGMVVKTRLVRLLSALVPWRSGRRRLRDYLRKRWFHIERVPGSVAWKV